MKELKLKGINLLLSNENGNVRVKSNNENIIFINQTIDNIIEIIELNFNIVDNFYRLQIAKKPTEHFDLLDLNQVSISIVLHYLYIYNNWKNVYKSKANLDLKFNENDFNNPSTSDLIMFFYKKKYPNEWERKSSVLLEMSTEELQKYYNERDKFYNK